MTGASFFQAPPPLAPSAARMASMLVFAAPASPVMVASVVGSMRFDLTAYNTPGAARLGQPHPDPRLRSPRQPAGGSTSGGCPCQR